jgi:hypothetical protein
MRTTGLFALLLASCASSGRPAPNLWLRTEHEDAKTLLYFETQKLHPRSKSITMKSEGAPGRLQPPTIEAGEATIAYLHHWQAPSDSLADDARGTTLLFIFDHIPLTPWRVELPAAGVQVVYFQEPGVSGEAVGGWIRVVEAGERRLAAELEIAIETRPPGASKPVTLYLGGRFSVER